ncbi:ead/Ea22-like family protein [Serratia marcescens]|uniref:ead/Ea22-like family protein n=1 Tax=Serratia marcescens TaxID=615 RepID=UPI0013DBBCD6|nr:ead/Ea22-like family protein [Serratia marcescens]
MKTTRNELKLRAEKCPIKRFKAFIGKANTQATLCADTGIEIIGWSGFDASDLNAKSHRVELARFIAAADPETILSLLAELETKDKRIAELEAQVKVWESAATKHLERAEEAEKRLATPVRLLGEMLLHDWEHSVERQATFQHRKIAWDARLAEDKKAILAAGFTFTVEGGE